MRLEDVFKLDETRTTLALSQQTQKLRQTYKKKIVIRDTNTGKFWTKKLLDESGVDKDHMRKDRIATAVKMIPPGCKLILNIGVGDGELEKMIKKRRPYIQKIVGVDITHKGLLQAKRKSFFEAVCGSIYSLPTKGKFEAITVLEVLEHLPSDKIMGVFSELKKRLNKRGKLIISVPVNEKYTSDYNPNGHLRRYSVELIIAELRLSGFTLEKTETLSAFETFYGLKKYLSRTIFPKRWEPNVVVIKAVKR